MRVMPTQPIVGHCINIAMLKSVKIHRTGPKIRGTRHHLASGVEDRELPLRKARDVSCVMRCRDDFVLGERRKRGTLHGFECLDHRELTIDNGKRLGHQSSGSSPGGRYQDFLSDSIRVTAQYLARQRSCVLARIDHYYSV